MNSKAIARVSGEAGALDGRAITAATGDLNSKVKCTSSWKITVA